MIKAKVIGQGSLRSKLRKLGQAQRAGLKRAVGDSLAEVQKAARESLDNATRSAEGTGTLARSVTVELDPDGLGGRVGTDLRHGRFLEFGTRSMAARPWLQPAFDALKPQIRRRFRNAVKDANRKAVGGAPGGGTASGRGIDI